MDIPGLLDTRETHLATFTIVAGGTPLDGQYSIVSIEVRREANRIPKATIVLIDGDPSAQTFAISEEDTLIPGADVEIRGGYSSEESTLFIGVITRHRIEIAPDGGHRLVVEIRDPVFRLSQGRRSRNFTDLTDADVMEQIISLHPGLTPQVEATTQSHPQIVQHQVSDWDFLVIRAEMNDCDVIAIDGTVNIAPPTQVGAAVASAIFGQGLFAAELELDAETQLAGVETGGWDTANQELTLTDTDDAATPGPGDISGREMATGVTTALRHPGARDQSTLDRWAGAEMGRQRRAAIRGRLKVQGTEVLVPGVLIELEGMGSRFNGLAYVSGIRHRFRGGDWRTEVLIGSDPRRHADKFEVAAPAAGGALPPVPGLQIGVVAALEADPLGEDRIQIQIATISETDGLVWARQAVLDAGDGRGTAFRPEIGDEVIVGFLDGDPRDPIILGAVHSSAKPTPIPGADDNHEKAIVTRSGSRLHFNDDTVVVTIDTPGGNKIVLSEDEGAILVEDENGNTVTLNSDGIALDSRGDIEVTAAGDVKIEGTNIELKANASVKVEGSAGAELTSSGSTVVKGSLVQIN